MSPSRRRRRASPEWVGREIITVAALPGRGLYVRHLGHPEGVDGVHRPTVPPPGAPWRSPAAFEPRWLAANLEQVDVVHVHGLPPRLPVAEVAAAVELVRAAGKPLVVTAYHVHDPTGADEDGFAARLEALIPAADAVVTLTPGVAREIGQRWRVLPVLMPHPHAVDFIRIRRPRTASARPGPFRVGAHLGSLRMPADPVDTVTALAEAASQLPDVRLSVRLHDHLLDGDSTRYAPAAVTRIQAIVAAAGGEVRLHRPMTDPDLWDYLFGLDVSILPPIHGTHSVWPEACYDLGTQVLIAAGSPAADQRPCLTYGTSGLPRSHGNPPDADSLHAALAAARTSTGWRADPAERWKERVHIAELHRALYERLLSARSG